MRESVILVNSMMGDDESISLINDADLLFPQHCMEYP